MERVNKSILLAGLLLIITGSATLLYLAYITVQIIQAPTEVALVKWFISNAEKSEFLVSGIMNNKAFEIHFSDALQYMFLGLIGLILVSILISVINSLISGGVKLVLFYKQTAPSIEDVEQVNQANR